MGHRVLQSQAELEELKDTLRTVDRKVTKVQSRVVLCAEQMKALRKLTMGTRTVATETLTNHANTLAEVTEQTNSLQHVVSALQDVVVKQIEVGHDTSVCPHAPRPLCLSHRAPVVAGSMRR